MLRKAMFLTVALMMALTVNASAQCQFGVYADAEGTQTSVVAQRNLGQAIFPLDVYYVMYVEDFVLGAAWNREVTGGPFTLVGAQQIYDPNSQFLEVTPNGFRMGLGDCQIGFGRNAVFVLHEVLSSRIVFRTLRMRPSSRCFRTLSRLSAHLRDRSSTPTAARKLRSMVAKDWVL